MNRKPFKYNLHGQHYLDKTAHNKSPVLFYTGSIKNVKNRWSKANVLGLTYSFR